MNATLTLNANLTLNTIAIQHRFVSSEDIDLNAKVKTAKSNTYNCAVILNTVNNREPPSTTH